MSEELPINQTFISSTFLDTDTKLRQYHAPTNQPKGRGRVKKSRVEWHTFNSSLLKNFERYQVSTGNVTRLKDD